MSTSELGSRLEKLEEHIGAAEARLKLKGVISADHKATAAELRGRYAALTDKLREDKAEAEAHGHHLSDLELSVRQLLGSLEIDMD